MAERALVVDTATGFATMWTNFEAALRGVSGGDAPRQVRLKRAVAENVLWQMVQHSTTGSDLAGLGVDDLADALRNIRQRRDASFTTAAQPPPPPPAQYTAPAPSVPHPAAAGWAPATLRASSERADESVPASSWAHAPAFQAGAPPCPHCGHFLAQYGGPASGKMACGRCSRVFPPPPAAGGDTEGTATEQHWLRQWQTGAVTSPPRRPTYRIDDAAPAPVPIPATPVRSSCGGADAPPSSAGGVDPAPLQPVEACVKHFKDLELAKRSEAAEEAAAAAQLLAAKKRREKQQPAAREAAKRVDASPHAAVRAAHEVYDFNLRRRELEKGLRAALPPQHPMVAGAAGPAGSEVSVSTATTAGAVPLSPKDVRRLLADGDTSLTGPASPAGSTPPASPDPSGGGYLCLWVGEKPKDAKFLRTKDPRRTATPPRRADPPAPALEECRPGEPPKSMEGKTDLGQYTGNEWVKVNGRWRLHADLKAEWAAERERKDRERRARDAPAEPLNSPSRTTQPPLEQPCYELPPRRSFPGHEPASPLGGRQQSFVCSQGDETAAQLDFPAPPPAPDSPQASFTRGASAPAEPQLEFPPAPAQDAGHDSPWPDALPEAHDSNPANPLLAFGAPPPKQTGLASRRRGESTAPLNPSLSFGVGSYNPEPPPPTPFAPGGDGSAPPPTRHDFPASYSGTPPENPLLGFGAGAEPKPMPAPKRPSEAFETLFRSNSMGQRSAPTPPEPPLVVKDPPAPKAAPAAATFALIIASIDGKRIAIDKLTKDTTVLEVKRKVQEKWKATDAMKVIHNGTSWENTATLAEVGVEPRSTLHVMIM
eukprot:TRINITY_DN19756_c0_g1_i2.p1 TRINITY_DN19756_c0_g1~~TRINITY_DN19756_c0_g1_i2.p1  ORF type:complete len:824 (+),score=241.07 TRINITY_DN19756_c0_g1_i2:100-2571(+)